MAGELHISTTEDKAEKYKVLISQIKSLTADEENRSANLANIAAALKQTFDFFWVGFYLVDEYKKGELVLGPFQGPVACTRIKKGKGVCGTSWEKKQLLRVDDVDEFPGHIACSAASKSEIVIPITNQQNEVSAVLDIDSDKPASFDKTDEKYLVELTAYCKRFF